jgi:hypothetical protein
MRLDGRVMKEGGNVLEMSGIYVIWRFGKWRIP